MIDVNTLKEAAKRQGLTIKQLAELVDMSETGFHQAMGNRTLKAEVIESLAVHLGKDISEFFTMEANHQKIINNIQHGDGNTFGVNSVYVTHSMNNDNDHRIELLENKVAHLEEQVSIYKQLVISLQDQISLRDQTLELYKAKTT